MKKRKFADAIIVFCVLLGSAITAVVLYEYHRLNTVIPANVLTTLISFPCGELLIVALRQVFGADVVKQKKPKSLNDEEEIKI